MTPIYIIDNGVTDYEALFVETELPREVVQIMYGPVWSVLGVMTDYGRLGI